MPEPTYYAKKLVEELAKKGIKAELEYNDGHKSVDIFIPEANLEIEVDGNQHYSDPTQAFTDLMRTKHSMLKGKETIRVPNTLVYNNLPQTANLIEEIVKDRVSKKKTKKVSKEKKRTLEQTLPKKTVEKYKVKFNIEKSRIFFEEKRKRKLKTLLKILAIILGIGLILFLSFYFDHHKKVSPSADVPQPTVQEYPSQQNPPEIKPILVESSNTDVIINNNKQKDVSLNVTYRIYSNWFGIDKQESQIFEVNANSQESFKVYNNDGCLTAPCSVSIISYSEI